MQAGLKEIVRAIHEFTGLRKVSETVKLLIPNTFVSKLIGISNLG